MGLLDELAVQITCSGRVLVRGVALDLALLCIGLPEAAAMAQDPANSNEVKVTLQPYVWVPTLNGNAKLGAVAAPVRVVPKDFVEGFKIGGMGSLKVERNRTFIYADAIIVDYDNREFRPFFEQPLRARIRYFDVGVGIHRKIVSLTVSPQIGVQHLYLLADVNGALITGRADGKWWSPTVGLTARSPVAKRLTASVSANAAGFGLGATNYQNAAASLHYRLGQHWTASAGFRAAKGRFSSPAGLSIDLDGSGPVIGVA